MRRDGGPLPGRLPRSGLGAGGQLHRRRARCRAEGRGDHSRGGGIHRFFRGDDGRDRRRHHQQSQPFSPSAGGGGHPGGQARAVAEAGGAHSGRRGGHRRGGGEIHAHGGALHELLRPAADPRSARYGDAGMAGRHRALLRAPDAHRRHDVVGRSAGGQPQLAGQRGADRRRLFHPTGGALRPHLRMGHGRAGGARQRLHAQSALSRPRRRGSGGGRLRTGYGRHAHHRYGVVHQWRGTLGSRHQRAVHLSRQQAGVVLQRGGVSRARGGVFGRPGGAVRRSWGEEQQMEIKPPAFADITTR
jgi:hypothetical protein